MSLKHVQFDLFNHFVIQDLLIQDQQKDTLLFAGEAKVNITDWFFMKDKVALKYLRLSDAYVNLYRKKDNDTWNYQFIIDAFASNNTSKSSKSNTFWNLKKIQLHNVRFHSTDQWVGNDMVYEVGDFELNAHEINYTTKTINIDNVKADKIVIGLRDYKSSKGYVSKKNKGYPLDNTAFNTNKWKVSLNHLALTDSRFFLEDPDTKAIPGEFDAWHINITGINADIKNIKINVDTITGKVLNLTAKERSGIVIKKMHADVKVSPRISECENLFLQTNNSTLTDYYAMHYNRFPDFIDYINKVKMVGHLKNATIAMKDIIYFAPYGLDRFKSMIAQVDADASGTVADLQATNIKINDGNNNITGNFTIKGLPNIDQSIIQYTEGSITTNAHSFFIYFPELQTDEGFDISGLGNITFKGNFKGLYNQFNVAGNIITNSGVINENIDFQFRTPTPSYIGSIATTQFNIGKFLKQDNVGNIAMNMHIDGKGFDPKVANVLTTGKVSSININDYTYQNIDIKGALQRKEFTGHINSQDTNLKMVFDGKVDFSSDVHQFNFTSVISYINAKKLNFTTQNLQGSGKLNINFTGNNIDNFIGNAQLNQMELNRDGIPLNIHDLSLSSLQNSLGEKELTLSGSGLQASIKGHFSIIDLPQSFQYFLSYYIPQYVIRPNKVNTNQQFQFNINTQNSDDLFSLFNAPVRFSIGTIIDGALDMNKQQLTINGTIPWLQINKNIIAKDITISGNGSNDSLNLNTQFGNIFLSGNTVINAGNVHTTLSQDSANFQINTTANSSLGNATINGTAYAQNDSFYFHLLPSEVFLNNNKWQIDSGNEAIIAHNNYVFKNFNIHSKNEFIRINTLAHPAPNTAILFFENFNLSNINDFTNSKDWLFDGTLNGKLTIQSINQQPIINFNLSAPTFLLNKDTLGSVALIGNYSSNTHLLHLKNNSVLFSNNSSIAINGDFGFDSTQNINASITLNNSRVQLAQPFLTGIFHNINGRANGNIDLSGTINNLNTSGNVTCSNIQFTTDATGVSYHIDTSKLLITQNKINIVPTKIYDSTNHTALLTGKISHNNLSYFLFDLNIQSDNIEVLNLSPTQSDYYYGNINAMAQMSITGPIDNIYISVNATPQKNAKLYIPISNGIDLNKYDYIRFKSKNDTLSNKHYTTNNNNYHLRINAIANPNLECYIILDPNTREQIWAKGNGNLILDIPAVGDMRLNGNYNIDEGYYDFAFKQLQILNYKQRFIINPNSNIKWDGNIYNATLAVTAMAQIQARLYDLIANDVKRMDISNSEIKDAEMKQPVNVMMNMNGSLQQPEFSFKLELPENHSVGTYAYQRLQRINTDDKELLNQVASLLVLKQFLPPEGFTSNTVSTGAVNNMSEVASVFASTQLTNFTNKVLGLKDVHVGVQYKNYNLSNAGVAGITNRNEAAIGLRKNFLNDRLIVEVGGVYDWGRSTSSQNQLTSNLAGDFRVQYLLTEDGRIRLNVFRTSDYDPVYLQNISRQGIGLMYRKSFNSLYDFLNKNDKTKQAKKPKDPLDTPPNIDTIKQQ